MATETKEEVKKCFIPNPKRLELGRHSYGSAEILSWGRPECVIKVGNFCSLAGGIKFIIDGNHRIDYASTFPFFEYLKYTAPPNVWGKTIPVIGNDVWIGMDVTIYSGVNISDGAVIAGQSVVTKNVPPYAVVAGNPATIRKYRFSSDIINRFLKCRWWDLPDPIIKTHLAPIFHNVELFLITAEKYAGK